MPLYLTWPTQGPDVRALRTKLGFNQADFADRIQCVEADLQAIERGNAAPGVSIGAHLGTSKCGFNLRLTPGKYIADEEGLFTYRLVELKQQVYDIINRSKLEENFEVIEGVMQDLAKRYHLEMSEAASPAFRFRKKGALFNPTEETVRDMIADAKRKLGSRSRS